jgi:hypothetical protein
MAVAHIIASQENRVYQNKGNRTSARYSIVSELLCV